VESPVRPLVVWRFSDGKAGHDNQSRGLTEALAGCGRSKSSRLNPLPPLAALLVLALGGRRRWLRLAGAGLCWWAPVTAPIFRCWPPAGAGAASAVVLMRPSLPLSLFDLCLIPEHDTPPARSNVLATRGALNRIQPSSILEPDRGLLLIGGPSAHFSWDDAGLHRQIAAVLAADADDTLDADHLAPHAGLVFSAWSRSGGRPNRLTERGSGGTKTGPDWLPAQLARAGRSWVTADSVSMVYEALDRRRGGGRAGRAAYTQPAASAGDWNDWPLKSGSRPLQIWQRTSRSSRPPNLQRSRPLRPLDRRAMVRLSVAQLLPALNGGGVERGTLEVARELVRRGHRSVVISAGGRLVPELLRRQRASGLAAGRQVAAGPCAGFGRCGAGWPNSASTFCTPVRACRPGSLAGLARHGPGDSATLRHHRAWAVFGFPLQRHHDPRRAGDRRVRDRARLSCNAIIPNCRPSAFG
jgi:hypothetical protein